MMTDAQIQAFVRATAKPVKVNWDMKIERPTPKAVSFTGSIDVVRAKLRKIKCRGKELAQQQDLQNVLLELPEDWEVTVSYYVSRVSNDSWNRLVRVIYVKERGKWVEKYTCRSGNPANLQAIRWAEVVPPEVTIGKRRYANGTTWYRTFGEKPVEIKVVEVW